MDIDLSREISKNIIFQKIESFLGENEFDIITKETERPWGGFFVINESQSEEFIKKYFAEVDSKDVQTGNKLSPKILVVAPGKRLSWQYHFRRAELWKVIGGEVAIATSDTDEENETKKYSPGSIIKLKKGERHRLIGLNSWGIVAEIWQHTDKDYPSDEEDIVRLQDDFGR